jgi:hypothetical protein
MSSKTWLIVFIVILLLAVVGVTIGLTCSKSHALDKDLNYKAVSALPSLSKYVSKLNTMYVPYDNNHLPLTVPMTWDEEEGGYLIVLGIDNSWISLVFDSGSSHISAKGLNCEWKQCDDSGTCTVTSCPKTASYIPRGPQVALNQQNSSLLEYGSQKSSVTHHIEPFALFDLRLNCADFIRAGSFQSVQEFLAKMFPLGAPMVSFGPTLLYNVYSIEGTTTSNIFGLAQNNSYDSPSVLSALLPEKSKDRVWSLACKPQHAFFSLGALRCYGVPKFVALLQPAAFQKFLTTFYVVKLKDIAVVGGKSVRKSNLPKFVVLDTGTTYTYCNKTLAAGLQEAGYRSGTSSINLVLGSSINSVSLHYEPPALKNAFLTDLPDLDTMFNNVPVLLMGVEQMFNFYFEYNLTQQMLGICSLSETSPSL